MKKTVYVVQTIEYGALGVWSNKKAAWGHGQSLCPDNKTGSYKELCDCDRTTLKNADGDETEIVPVSYATSFEEGGGDAEAEEEG